MFMHTLELIWEAAINILQIPSSLFALLAFTVSEDQSSFLEHDWLSVKGRKGMFH